MLGMKWIESIVFSKSSGNLVVYRRTDRRTDRYRGESSIPPFHLRWSGVIIRNHTDTITHFISILNVINWFVCNDYAWCVIKIKLCKLRFWLHQSWSPNNIAQLKIKYNKANNFLSHISSEKLEKWLWWDCFALHNFPVASFTNMV